MDSSALLYIIHDHFIYHFFLFFVAAYPIFGAIVWISTANLFWQDIERQTKSNAKFTPFVSIVISAYNEAKVLPNTLRKVLAIDYPHFEVIVINDGSSDATFEVAEPFLADIRMRIIHKTVNEGKALAINDAISCFNGEIVLFLDADAEPDPDILWRMLPHYLNNSVGAVTGNPRIKNTKNFLCRLQLMEYTTIISLIRRAQQVWGCLMTVSGAVFSIRKTALLSVEGFSPNMYTEDIDLTWKIQRASWEVIYEPAALAWIQSPSTFGLLWRQRRRWARGLMQVLKKNSDVIFKHKYRHIWPVFLEASLSTLWQFSFIATCIVSLFFYLLGVPVLGVSVIPYIWGLGIATFSIGMHAVGTWFDHKYDKEVTYFYPYAIYYPIIYWMMMAIVSTISIPSLFRKIPTTAVKWKTQRD